MSYIPSNRSSDGTQYVNNPSATNGTLGWATYADAAGARPVDGTGGTANTTWTATATTPLDGAYSFLFTKNSGASRQGEGVSYDFVVDQAAQGSLIQISFDLSLVSGTWSGSSTPGTDSDVIVDIYDVTNGALIEPSSILLNAMVTGQFYNYKSTFQTAINSTSYRVCFHIAKSTDSAFVLKYDNVKIGRQLTVNGAAVSDYRAATINAVLKYGTTNATNATVTAKVKQIGDSASGLIGITFSGAANAEGGMLITLPNALTIDTTKLADSFQVIGKAFFFTSSKVYNGLVRVASSTQLHILTTNTTGATAGSYFWQGSNTAGNNVPSGAAIANADQIDLQFDNLPIVGWSSNISFASESGDARLVALRASRNGVAYTTFNPNASAVKVPFNSTLSSLDQDTHGAFDSTNNRYYIPSSGSYYATANVSIQATNMIVSRFIISIFKNGVEVLRGNDLISTASQGFGLVVSGNFKATAGEYIECFIYGAGNFSVSNLTIDGAAGSSQFCISKLQGPSAIAAVETVACSYSSSSGQSIANGASDVTVVYGTKVYDTHGAYNSATGIFTAPVSGKYKVDAMVMYTSANWSATGLLRLFTYKNASQHSAFLFTVQTALTGQYISLAISDTIQLLAGETTLIATKHPEATPRTLDVGPIYNKLNITKVGNY